jgi:hypothetical protein
MKCHLHGDVKVEENAKRHGLSYIAAPSTAKVSHRTHASSGTFCDSYCVQDGDKGTAICEGIRKKCTGGGGDVSLLLLLLVVVVVLAAVAVAVAAAHFQCSCI